MRSSPPFNGSTGNPTYFSVQRKDRTLSYYGRSKSDHLREGDHGNAKMPNFPT